MLRLRRQRRFKKILSISAIGFTFIALVLALDMIIGGSIYHPLTYVYNIISWLSRKNSPNPVCKQMTSDVSFASVSGKNGVVVSSQHLASEAGLKILKDGGNAIDAAVAVGYALAVTHPCCGNIGGGGLLNLTPRNLTPYTSYGKWNTESHHLSIGVLLSLS